MLVLGGYLDVVQLIQPKPGRRTSDWLKDILVFFSHFRSELAKC